MLQQVLQFFAAAGVGQFNQHMPWVRAVQRILAPRHVRHHDVQLVAVDHFKGRQARTTAALEHAQYVQRRLRAVRRHPGHGVARGQGMQLEHGGGDDAQRAFGANEQLLEVVARVVLAQTAQRGVDAAVGQHGLDAQREVAHIAVAQHGRAAGVGREIAADLARTFGAYAQREQAPGFFGRGACGLQRDAGLQRHGVVDDVELLHLVHAAQIEHHGVAGGVGHGAAHQRSVAALGHDRHVVRKAQGQHGADLLGGGRQHDGQRLAVVELAVVGGEGLHVAGDFNAGFLADDGTQAFEQQRGGERGNFGHVQ
ncbi:hypothetical protein D3C78_1104450 [compost metagenome]